MNDTPPQEDPWYDRAAALVKNMGAQGLDHPSSKNVLIGAGIGTAISLPFAASGGFLLGALIGSGIAIARELDKQDT